MTLILMAALAFAGDTPDASASTDTSAVAQTDGAAAAAPASEKHAEYIRLAQEMQKLATRNAWAGVERNYEQIVATGVPPTFDDYLIGANAAKAIGDVTSAKERLLAANAMKEDPDVLNSLWDIDSNYGPISLMGDPTKVTLRAGALPFDPNQAKAVEFATAQVATTGAFEGLLPQGTYHFMVGGADPDKTVRVQPRVQATRIDVRSDEYMEKLEKEAKARNKKKP